ncbi:3-hydroxyacyl-CoA dehydrogenase NAD-binding domain-containing protein [Lichenicoccus sp.]|uniref:3-hydroxyacyl-CoA dehydrogenase/enoyl-CoA hydratase family protein n=1 Tax=Lichenicoccus sp. TaxID=2781899 RepID=UPI003D143D1D
MSDIRKACVVGAGVMGVAIAAQIANSGTPVLLLDIPPKDPGAPRDQVARDAVARALKTEPAPFMSRDAAKLVTTGCIDDDLAQVAACDWIIEAIIERLDLKQALYRKLDAHRRPGCAVSSNTSTIPLAQLTAGLPEHFATDFLITHFFNPPRYMRLLEIVPGAHTDPRLLERISNFCDRRLGKSVVRAHDTPGFIANRIGTFWLQRGLLAAMDAGLTVEEADAAMGRTLGIPKTGIFGLLDLVGLDLMPHINASMQASLPERDPFRAVLREVPLLNRMIEQGLIGRKGKGGFYRVNRTGGKIKESIGLVTGEYEPSRRAELPAALARDPAALLASDHKLGRYAWTVMGATLSYAASLVPEIAGDIASVDAAMRLGFNWKFGPFELLDRIGPAVVAERLAREGETVPKLLTQVGDGRFYRTENGEVKQFGVDGGLHTVARAEGVLLLEDIKCNTAPLLKNGSAAAWDIGDGVVCFEITTKMNSFDEQVLTLLGKTIAMVKERFTALVLYTDAENFSAGANLGLALFAANIAAWGEIEKSISAGQQAFKALKYAPFPVVAAPAGLALGGGCEIALHADAIQAHAELYMGLVECGVGLVPGWGGNGEMLARWQTAPGLPRGPMPAASKLFETVSTATVSKSAAEARALLFLRETDGITMNRDRLLADAKARALSMVTDYTAPAVPELRLSGAGGRAAMQLAVAALHKQGMAKAHDLVVADGLAELLSGGDTDLIDPASEKSLLDLERRMFMRLIRTPATLARIEHMLETGKPLRN